MKKTITKIIMLAFIGLSNVTNGQAPDWIWANSGGSTGAEGGSRTTTDASGNVYVTGYYDSPVITFGADTLINTGGYDFFLVKYDASGNAIWAKGAGGAGNEFCRNITTDPSGNVFVTGNFFSFSLTFGATTLFNSAGGDLFIVKYDPNGNVLWAKKQDAGGSGSDYGMSVAADGSGNVILTGSFGPGSITFGTTTLTNFSNIYSCIFIVKYDGNGNVLWVKGASGNSTGNSVSTDASGNVFVTGTFITPSIVFGSIVLYNPDNPHSDMFIVKYGASGNLLWAKRAGGSWNDNGGSTATDASGNVYVSGYYTSPSITFGATTLTNAGSTNSNPFIVKYAPNGNVLWARQQDAGGSLNDAANSIAADANGNLLVSGNFESDSITFGTTTLTNAGSTDLFLVKYDATGNVLWAMREGGTGDENGNSVALDVSGNVYVSGEYSSPSITFGTSTLTNAGGSDVFIARLETTTGIADYTFNNEISVYPNPTTGLLFLTSNCNITLSDLTGKIVMQEQNTNAIDISNQPAGMYFLLLTDNKGRLVQRSKVTKE